MSCDTIHHDDINKSFHEAIIKNYQTLLSEQVALCGVRKHQFKLSEMKPVARVDRTKAAKVNNVLSQMGYTVGDSLVSYPKRYTFFSHNLNEVLLSQADISSPQYFNLFEKNFLFFIDGYYIDDVQVLGDDNDITFVLNISDTKGIPGGKYSEFIANDATVTVYTVPNFVMYSKKISRNTLDNNNYNLNDKVFKGASYSENSLIFVNTSNDIPGMKSLCDYKFIDNSQTKLNVEWLANRKLNQCYITVLNIPQFTLMKTMNFTKDSEPYFQIPGMTGLIPTDNLLPIPYSLTVPNELSNYTKTKFSLYYPNIYKFEYEDSVDWDSSMYLGYFHDASGLSEYDNKLKLFHKYITNIVDAYNQGSISEQVRDYVPLDVKYYNELYSDTIHAPYTFAYKVDEFHKYAEIDPDLLVNYLYTKLKGKMRHYVNMNKLDLVSRVRIDNSNERVPYNVDEKLFSNNFDKLEFDEPHYVFSLSKSIFGPDEEFRFYLDNIALMQHEYYIQDDVDWYHVYIPCRRVTKNSVLEIEKFAKIERTIMFNSEDTASGIIDFTLPNDMRCIMMNTMHLYDVDTLAYLTDEDFSVSIPDDVIETDIELQHKSRASILKTAKITLHNQSYHGSKLAMYIRTYPTYGEYNTDEGGVTYFKDNVGITRRHIKAYKNGIFLNPESFIRFVNRNPGMFNAQIGIFCNIEYTDKDMMAFDVMPFAAKRELFIQDVFCNDLGFVDVGDALSLPIDLKWYDVYVNGRKLNKTNIEIISPSKFFVKNIDSKKNLEIWLRGDAPQEFNFANFGNTINDIIWDKDNFIKDAINNSQDILSDTLDDIFDEFSVNILDQYKDFVEYVFQYTFINPNEMQLSQEIADWYPDLFNQYGVMWLDSNSYTDAEFKTFINSNVRDDNMKEGQYRYGFTPMHIGSHDDAMPGEYMCDPLTGLPGIKDESDETIIPGGSINRVVSHKNKFNAELGNIGMTRANVYQLQFADNVTSKLITPNTSILEETDVEIIDTPTPRDICLSLDVDILTADTKKVMGLTEYDPIVRVEYYYYAGGTKISEHFSALLSYLSTTPISIYHSSGAKGFYLDSISIQDNPEAGYSLSDMKVILHSILIAF